MRIGSPAAGRGRSRRAWPLPLLARGHRLLVRALQHDLSCWFTFVKMWSASPFEISQSPFASA